MAFPKKGVFNIKYPTRRKMANILKRLIDTQVSDRETGTLKDSVRINAKIPALGNLEIEIVAMYYFIFLNNGANLWNGGVIEPFEWVGQLQDEMDSKGITADIYAQYTEWLTVNYPILDLAKIIETNKNIVYTFYALDAPAGFVQGGAPLEV